MKRIPLCAAVLLLFSLLACKNKPAASSDKRPASASDTLSDDALMDTVQRRTFPIVSGRGANLIAVWLVSVII